MRGVVWPRLSRWMYRSGHPNPLARLMNRVSAIQFGVGFLAPRDWVTVEVRGRSTGRVVSFPAVVVHHGGHGFLVSMLGERAHWVRNVRADGGRAVLRRGRRRPVRLVEVPVGDRAPILRRYLAVAPGARPHFPLDRSAPVADFEDIADRYPVFRVEPVGS
ncbi:nitroreductase/quinone reductase family protein [Virgisporangium ochraceum]|nr:nitroreductase/quinone reductase family protein [Virgisporangium ochraceum]